MFVAGKLLQPTAEPLKPPSLTRLRSGTEPLALCVIEPSGATRPGVPGRTSSMSAMLPTWLPTSPYCQIVVASGGAHDGVVAAQAGAFAGPVRSGQRVEVRFGFGRDQRRRARPSPASPRRQRRYAFGNWLFWLKELP